MATVEKKQQFLNLNVKGNVLSIGTIYTVKHETRFFEVLRVIDESGEQKGFILEDVPEGYTSVNEILKQELSNLKLQVVGYEKVTKMGIERDVEVLEIISN